MKIYTNDLVKGHSDFKVKCLTFGLFTQVSDSGPLDPLVSVLWISASFKPELQIRGRIEDNSKIIFLIYECKHIL